MVKNQSVSVAFILTFGLNFLCPTKSDYIGCTAGTEWSDTNQGCLPCPRGFYRTTYYEFCQPCPSGYSTHTTGAQSIGECGVELGVPESQPFYQGTCEAGYELDPATNMCHACAIGTFKEQEGIHACSPCPMNKDSQPASTAYSGSTSQLHCIVDVKVVSISPQRTLQAGGSTLTIEVATNATQVRIDSVHSMAGVHCYVSDPWLHDKQIQCRMSSTSKLAEGEVAFYVQSGTGHSLQECMSAQRIHVMPNPVVRRVYRNDVFVGGGVTLRIDVTHAQSAVRTRAVFYQPNTDHNVTQECEPISDEHIECIMPDLSAFTSSTINKRSTSDHHPLRVHYGLIFDDWWFYANLSDVISDLEALEVTANPNIWDFERTYGNEVLVFDMSNQHPSLIFEGENLATGVEMEDYNITIATARCYVSMLSDASLECTLLDTEYRSLAQFTRHKIRVKLGNLLFEPGYIEIRPNGTSSNRNEEPVTKSSSDQNYIIIIAILLTLIAIAAVIIAIMCFNKNCKNKPFFKKVKNNKCTPYGSREQLTVSKMSPYHQRAPYGDTWGSTSSTLSSMSSKTRLPLPINAVFGPGRRTGDSDVIMRPTALPRNC